MKLLGLPKGEDTGDPMGERFSNDLMRRPDVYQ